MANFLFALPGISYTATPSSEDSNHPATNLKLYGNIQQDYRSEVITEVNIVFDLGNTYSNVLMLMDGCNFTNFALQAHTTDSWGAPTVNNTGLKMVAKPWVQPNTALTGIMHRYAYQWQPSGFTNLRYVRLVIAAQTPTDSAAYFRIGRIAIIASTSQWSLSQNPDWEFEEWSDAPTGKLEYPGGGSYYALGDNLQWRGSIQFDPFLKTYLSEIQALNAIPKDRVIVMCTNISGTKEDFWFCYRESAFEHTHQYVTYSKINRIDFMEAL